MRKLALLVLGTLCVISGLFAQKLSVTGKVTDSTGAPIPGATVKEKGGKAGISADNAGVFKIQVNPGARLLVSATGFFATEVAASSNVSVVLSGDIRSLNEVVVTALGIRRRPKEVGFANTTVTAEKITSGNSPTLGQALSGKVAGLTIQNQNASVNSDVRITLRGNRSITGNNQALLVVDGIPVPQNTLSYINPNDIENVTVLKGGNSAALYGSDGANGVLMITTKKGAGTSSVNFKHTSTIEGISFLPDFQDRFGTGSDYGGAANSMDNFRPFENQQYGDRFDGQMREQGRVLEDGSYQNLKYSPIKNNRRDAFDKGNSMQNDASFSGGDRDSKYFLSLQDYRTNGVVPGDKYRRNNVRFNSSKMFFGKLKASFDGSYTVDRTERTNTGFYFLVQNTAANIPLSTYRDWRNNKFANPNGYYNDYYASPYFAADNDRNDDRNNIISGNFSFEYKPLSWLTATYRLGTAVTNNFGRNYVGQFLYTTYAKKTAMTHTPAYNDYNGLYFAANDILGNTSDYSSNGTRLNSDFLLSFQKTYNKISANFLLGNNVQTRSSKTTNVNSTSLVVPGLYNVGNRAGDLGGSASVSEQRKFSYFGDLTLGYNDYLFLHGSLRNDNTSIFYRTADNGSSSSYWFYGVDASLSMTDAFPSLKSKTLSYLKLRANYSLNRLDNIGPYSLDATFSTAAGFPYGNVVGFSLGNSSPDPNLRPETIKGYEAGFEASFLNSRINLDFSFYNQKTEDALITAGISSATGYTSILTNAASLKNKGVEIELKGSIVKNRNFNWEVSANYTYNTNKVISIFRDLPRFQSASLGTSAFLFAELNQPFPYLKASAWSLDSLGRTIVNKADGWPVRDANLRGMGNTLPKHVFGFSTNVSYKSFTFSTTLEARTSYVIYNAIGHDLAFTGAGAKTVEYDRMPYLFPNSSYTDGAGKFVANSDIMVSPYYAWYNGYGNVSNTRSITSAGVGAVMVTSGNFLKVRDASITYNFPKNFLNKTKAIKGASITIVGRNLLTFLPKENIYTDPEFSATSTSSNAQGINTSINTPPIRSYGATLNLNF